MLVPSPVSWNPQGAMGGPIRAREEQEAPDRLARVFAAMLLREVLKAALPEGQVPGGFAGAVHRDMLLDVLAERVADAAGEEWLGPLVARLRSSPAGGRG